MTTEVVTLALGLAFFIVVLVLGILVLRSPSSALKASAQAGKFGVSFDLSSEAKAEVAKHLDQALSKKESGGDVVGAKQELNSTTALRIRRLLWVDDHPDNNIYEVLMLEKLGISMTTTTSTSGAMTYLANARYDLLITDMGRGLHKNAGIELAKEVRAVGHSVPIVVYSMDRGIGHEQDARALGIDAFAVTPDQLLANVLRIGRDTQP